MMILMNLVNTVIPTKKMFMEKVVTKKSKMERFNNWVINHLPHATLGSIFSAASAYFQPIKGIILITMVVIIVDLIFGVWSAIVKKESIDPDKLWRTISKMLITFTILHLLYSIDKEYGISTPHTYIIAGLFIIGFEVYSIFKSFAIITNHRSLESNK